MLFAVSDWSIIMISPSGGDFLKIILHLFMLFTVFDWSIIMICRSGGSDFLKIVLHFLCCSIFSCLWVGMGNMINFMLDVVKTYYRGPNSERCGGRESSCS